MKTASFLGFVAEAITTIASRRAAEDMAVRYVSDTRKHNPVMIQVGNVQAILWRAHACWTYTFVTIDDTMRRGEIPHILTQDADVTFERTLLDAVGHVAHNAWRPSVADDLAFFGDAFAAHVNHRIPADMIRKAVVKCVCDAKFQRVYQASREAGLKQQESFDAAGAARDKLEEAMNRPELAQAA
jgi:hypothetical protein